LLRSAGTPAPPSNEPAGAPSPSALADDAFYQPVVELGRRAGAAGLTQAYCIHGSFAGNDPLGLVTELSRFLPAVGSQLAAWGKRSVDWAAGELGNFTTDYCQRLERGLSAGAGRRIPVGLFHWSSQNNHIGRADGAVRLLDELARLGERRPAVADDRKTPRVLLWAHSHGGNVLALTTCLLAADAAAREEFFGVCRAFYQRWCLPGHDLPHWVRVRDLLAREDHPLRRFAFDLATFGTPIRYGWRLRDSDSLVHWVNHRPAAGLPEYRAFFSQDPRRILQATDGDYVQQLGIAGTNLPPNPAALRTVLADRRLGRLLERDLPRESLIDRWQRGMRVADAGLALLVDYQEPRGNPLTLVAGHAVYTRSAWLPFHCRQLADACFPQ